jgi:hypothetical protein
VAFGESEVLASEPRSDTAMTTILGFIYVFILGFIYAFILGFIDVFILGFIYVYFFY